MNDYLVIANLGSEAISLGAENESEALRLAKETIAEQYGKSVAESTIYTVNN